MLFWAVVSFILGMFMPGVIVQILGTLAICAWSGCATFLVVVILNQLFHMVPQTCDFCDA